MLPKEGKTLSSLMNLYSLLVGDFLCRSLDLVILWNIFFRILGEDFSLGPLLTSGSSSSTS